MTQKQTILASLDVDLPMTLQEIADETNLEKPTISVTLTDLKKAGKVHRDKEGWLLVPPGAAHREAKTSTQRTVTSPPVAGRGLADMHQTLAKVATEIYRTHGVAMREVSFRWIAGKDAQQIEKVSVLTEMDLVA